MSNGREVDKPCLYQIRVKENLATNWQDWFEGFTIIPLEEGETVLTGWVVDQAELFGILIRIRDMGIPLISVTRPKQTGS